MKDAEKEHEKDEKACNEAQKKKVDEKIGERRQVMGIMSVLSKIFGVKIPAVEGKEVGKITHYYGHLSVGIIELSDMLKVGDKIHIKGHTSDFTQDVKSLQIEHKDVPEAKRGDLVGIKILQKAHPNDKVYKIT